MRIVVTGASGFIGGFVTRRLAEDGHELVLLGATREPAAPAGIACRTGVIGPIELATNLRDFLEGADAVVHLAGCSKVPHDQRALSAEIFRSANVEAVSRVVETMGSAGVTRLVLISSIAAKLLTTEYGRSKREGEEKALAFARAGGQVSILRPPPVYGPAAPGNLGRLLRLVESGLPLPFASVSNARSLCAVENLAEAVADIVRMPNGSPEPYEVCDDGWIGLPKIIEALAEGLGKRVFLVPVPEIVLRLVAKRMLSKAGMDALLGSLVLDNGRLKEEAGWTPPISTVDGLRAMALARTV